jgi:histidinol-phosphate/aromatic aminotransferase/cobyric acid decarboxylase-like protein
MMGAQVAEFRLRIEDNFQLDGGTLLARVRETKPRLLFLCNPNNPTGTYVDGETLTEILSACPDTLIVLDEAFVRFLSAPWASNRLLEHPNLLILRSLTKDYALTALRVGYAVGSPSIIAALEKVQPPWSVNSFAQVAAVAAMSDDDFFRSSLRQLADARQELVHELTQMGLTPLSSPLAFFLLPTASAVDLTRNLLTHNIRVRDCTSFGVPRLVRIATRRPTENIMLLSALRELVLQMEITG